MLFQSLNIEKAKCRGFAMEGPLGKKNCERGATDGRFGLMRRNSCEQNANKAMIVRFAICVVLNLAVSNANLVKH